MKVLYITHNGLTEPLGRRQVLPYVLGLAARGWRHTVISFEKAETADSSACAQVRALTGSAGVRWVPLRYHRRPVLASTAFDSVHGLLRGIAEAGGIHLIHARSTVPGAIGATLAPMRRLPWIFDVRGLVAEEYADAGHWNRSGALFRMTERVEKRLLRSARALVFLTRQIRDQLFEAGRFRRDVPTAVIPCGADLSVFRPSSEARQRVRRELGLGQDPVLAYVGSLGSWYRFREMADFLAVAEHHIPGLRFLVLTPQAQLAQDMAREKGIEARVIIRTLRPEDVPAYLCAADAGICFLVDALSKKASSPTKYGEYLATGLPVITNRWTGDASRLDGDPAWILVDGFSQEEYRQAARRLVTLLRSPATARERARALAEREFSLEAGVGLYDRLYRQVLGAGP